MKALGAVKRLKEIAGTTDTWKSLTPESKEKLDALAESVLPDVKNWVQALNAEIEKLTKLVSDVKRYSKPADIRNVMLEFIDEEFSDNVSEETGELKVRFSKRTKDDIIRYVRERLEQLALDAETDTYREFQRAIYRKK